MPEAPKAQSPEDVQLDLSSPASDGFPDNLTEEEFNRHHGEVAA